MKLARTTTITADNQAEGFVLEGLVFRNSGLDFHVAAGDFGRLQITGAEEHAAFADAVTVAIAELDEKRPREGLAASEQLAYGFLLEFRHLLGCHESEISTAGAMAAAASRMSR